MFQGLQTMIGMQWTTAQVACFGQPPSRTATRVSGMRPTAPTCGAPCPMSTGTCRANLLSSTRIISSWRPTIGCQWMSIDAIWSATCQTRSSKPCSTWAGWSSTAFPSGSATTSREEPSSSSLSASCQGLLGRLLPLLVACAPSAKLSPPPSPLNPPWSFPTSVVRWERAILQQYFFTGRLAFEVAHCRLPIFSVSV